MKINLVTFRGIPKNYSIVNSVLSRSAQPTEEDFATLKQLGVTDIIDFRTHFKEPDDMNFKEAKVVKKLGMRYHSIPSYTRHPSIEKINKFLDLVDNIIQDGGKVHIHCKAGADRTGMYVFAYKYENGIGTLAENVQEWIKFGHNQNIYPNLIEDTINILTKEK